MNLSDFEDNNDAARERHHKEDKMPGQTISHEAIQDWLIAKVAEELAVEPTAIDVYEPIASYGMDSVTAVGLSGDLEDWLGRELSPTLFYNYPTIAVLARYLAGETDVNRRPLPIQTPSGNNNEPIAIIGMGCRFPGGAATPEAFWQLLRSGGDATGEIPAERWDVEAFYDPDRDAAGKMYTRRGAFLQDIRGFDAQFFGISPREAAMMDPQQRLLVEVAWEALEDAGQSLSKLGGSSTGTFIGMMSNSEYAHLQTKIGYATGDTAYLDDPYFGIGNSSSIAAGRLAYLFDLQGPTMTLDTACSSSLVALHLGCQSLRNSECKLALAGGVHAMLLPENMVNACKMGMLAGDGRCKTFDASADGFALGEGCGIVVLKRLTDAQADGDNILAIIRGSAVNQDGRSNGITAPSKLAQEAVIRKALANAGVEPWRVSYVEAHGSGTALGDPIEIDALSAALGEGRSPDQRVMVGTVKTNIGHLAGAAGMAGLIKTVLALQHREIPPHLNLREPNPHICWEEKPVLIPTKLISWPSQEQTRIAGVSSFGWSGTNAHVVLEEAIPQALVQQSRPHQLLLLSAKTAKGLDTITDNLQLYLKTHTDEQLADIAYTTALGRTEFRHRRIVVSQNIQDAIADLKMLDTQGTQTGIARSSNRKITFLLAGVGEAYPGMAQELYAHEPVFRQTVDRCAALLHPLLGRDIREYITTPASDTPPSHNGTAHPQPAMDLRSLLGRNGSTGQAATTTEAGFMQTQEAQPLLFVIEYALAQLLMQWGIHPQAMLGYSLGEYVAACLAGVFSLEDALLIVARRAQLIAALPPGAMLAVALSEQDVEPYLSTEVCLAAVNAPTTCVLAGPLDAMAQLEARLTRQGIAARRVATTHAFHSSMLAPVQHELTELVGKVRLHAPQIPYLSNVTGTWITDAQATDAAYWAQHLCQTVRFAQGVEQLLQQSEQTLVEIGVGQALGSFVKQQALASGTHSLPLVVPTLPAATERQSGQALLLKAVGTLWLSGVTIDWPSFYADERRHLVSLPTYPFERQQYWLDSSHVDSQLTKNRKKSVPEGKKPDIADWFYLPGWQETMLPTSASQEQRKQRAPYLIFLDSTGIGEQIADRLAQDDCSLICVEAGTQFAKINAHRFTIRPQQQDDYQALIDALGSTGLLPRTILHLWSITPATENAAGPDFFNEMNDRGFYSLLYLAKALTTKEFAETVQLIAISNRLLAITEEEFLSPEKATLLGICKVIAQECPDISCRNIDIVPDSPISPLQIDQLIAECVAAVSEPVVAYRGTTRRVQTFAPTRLEARDASAPGLRQHGVYLITGGMGGIGPVLAHYLATHVQARLVLVGRSTFPLRAEWSSWLANHDDHEQTGRTIRLLQASEAAGAELLLLQADVGDAAQMQAVIQQSVQHFGAIHGVIHAAGITSESAFRPLQTLGKAECEQHFRPKVHGVFALEQVLHGMALDFCLLFSSISAVLGGLGFAGYAAANLFMDAFVQSHNRSSDTPWLSVNWDTWRVKAEQEQGIVPGATIAEYAMNVEEGLEVFNRVLTTKSIAQIVNSTGDLQTRIRQWVSLELLSDNNEVAQAHKIPLQDNTRPALSREYVSASSEYERIIASIWQQALGIAQVGLYDNFFDLGGNSLIGLQVIAKIKKALHVQIPAVALFEAPTISALVHYLLPAPAATLASDTATALLARRRSLAQQTVAQHDIAILGMSGRFPGAATLEQFWHNLREGVESVRVFTDAELLASGVDPTLLRDPHYVKARPILEDISLFDAAFFGYSPREAALTDPQHRLFLECCWDALEAAAYAPASYDGLIGVFGGTNISTYLLGLASDPDTLRGVDQYQLVIGNDKDSLTTSVSYKLNLKGPSFAVQTFCSTSLVAVHLACQSLLHGECDLALAGGVSLRVPTVAGHLYQEGGMESPDGHCRTFDAQAKGGLFGDGVGVVVLKRLSEALADGDPIRAVIKGSAINNDGSLKVSYTAPSVVGQAAVVTSALQAANVPAESIGYIEAHGTATELGDPIEVASLTKAFQTQTAQTGFCAIGSVKTNIGHLDRAAGVSGLIKTVLALEQAQLPPSLHFQSPNPAIDFVHSPFYVNTRLSPWPRRDTPRRAGINSLGMGGTNVHVIVEEAPPRAASGPSRPVQLLLLSAKTPSALEAMTSRLHDALQQHPQASLPDVAYTLQVGRSRFEQRRMLLCHTHDEALAQLAGTSSSTTMTSHVEQRTDRPVAFLFAGVGEAYPGMAHELYTHEPIFRQTVDRCAALLHPLLGRDIREDITTPATDTPPSHNGTAHSQPAMDLRSLLGRNGSTGQAATTTEAAFMQTQEAQPLLFVIEYALAQLLMQWGIHPQAMLGYSLGEYVAACLAGVFSLEDALHVVARRAQLIAALPPGTMLAVALSEQDVQPYLSDTVCLAAVNAPTTCVLAGPLDAMAQLEARLTRQGIAARRVATTHAFHSSMLAPVQHELTRIVEQVRLHAPQIPYLSNVTGTWITDAQATDAAYWAQHLCQTVRFAQGVEQLLQQSEQALVEIGVGQALGSFVKQQALASGGGWLPLVVPTLPAVTERQSGQALLLKAVGTLWLSGVTIDWPGFYAGEQRLRLTLPTYPFERQRYWLEPKKQARSVLSTVTTASNDLEKIPDISNWFSLPVWKQSAQQQLFAASKLAENRLNWLIFIDECGIGTQIIDQLREHDQQIISVMPGNLFSKAAQDTYSVNPGKRADYDALFKELREQGKIPHRIVHLWTTTPQASSIISDATLKDSLDRGFYSLLALAQAARDQDVDTCEISVISNGMQDVTGNEQLCPEKATIIGPCKVIAQEYPQLRSRSIDITLPEPGTRQAKVLLQQILGELTGESTDTFVALHGNRRWIQSFEPVQVTSQATQTDQLRKGGVYLITGGLGGIGLAMAEYLARTLRPKLVLVGRSGLPPRNEWHQLLTEHAEEDKISQQIRKVQMMEELGAEVLVLQADVADEARMQTVVQQAIHAFGTIHGVLHAAGVPGAGLIQHKTPQMAAKVLSPKVAGTLVLERVLQDIQLDFLVLFSSITSIIGGPGQVDYCAANAFLDAYAHHRFRRDGSTVAINWSEWQWNAWESGMTGLGEVVQTYFKENRRKFGIAFEEGTEALRRILSQPLLQAVVSTQDFRAVVEMNSSLTATTILQRAQQGQPAKAVHTRSEPGISYVAPRNELEQRIATVWEELLGISQVGINDNFFELGGNSLIGLDLITRMKKELALPVLPAYVLYEAPSVAAMAHYLEQEQGKSDISIEEQHERSEKRKEHLKQRMQGSRHKLGTGRPNRL